MIACVTLWCWMHAGAVTLDAVSTRHYQQYGYYEIDPLTRPLIGKYPTYTRMGPLGALETLGTAYLVSKHPRLKWLQVGLVATHAGLGVHNYTLGRRRR